MTELFGIPRALARARWAILTVALTYAVSLGIGMAMAQTGNEFALKYRDDLVSRAQASDPAAMAYENGDRLEAALLDFSRNLMLGALPNTLGGVGVVFPYPVAAYRGWVGGIVSVDSHHTSRLADPGEAAYYIIVVILQLLPYTLATAAGVNVGLAYFRPPPHYQGARWLGLPVESIRDAARIYVLVVPLFFIASLIEFLT